MQQFLIEIKIMQLLSLSVIIEAPLIIMIFNVRNFQKEYQFHITHRSNSLIYTTFVRRKEKSKSDFDPYDDAVICNTGMFHNVNICIVHQKSAFKFSTIMINIKKFQLFKHINSSSIQKIFTKSCALCKYASKRRHCRQIICGMS